MKQLFTFIIAGCTFSMTYGQISEFIHVDQFGYLSGAEKVAVLSNPVEGFNSGLSYTPNPTIEVRSLTGDVMVFSGNPIQWSGGSTHAQSGDAGWWFDFSGLTTPGEYYVYDPVADQRSAPFAISENPYHEVLKVAIKAFYYNRCNAPKERPYAADGWTDSNNFLNPLQDGNCRYVYDQSNGNLEKDLSGGWFDAGDYNKYVTFAHDPVHQLLSTFEENEMLFTDDWLIPESGNNIPDLLDEIKWELDWLRKMSNSDGSVHIKMGSINFNDNAAAPPSANKDPRYYGPTCTAASIALASMFAHAAKVFDNQPILGFSDSLLVRAELCWDYFIYHFNSNSLETACDDQTIKAGEADWSVEDQLEASLVAAVYLFELTGEEAYQTFFDNHYITNDPVNSNFWSPYQMVFNEALLLYSILPDATSAVADAIQNSAGTAVGNNWNAFYAFSNVDLYRAAAPDWIYHWGSNLPKANIGNLCRLFIKYNVLPASNQNLEQKAAEQLHYFHGVNPLGLVYLSNMYGYGGDRCADEIYHTWFNDGTEWDDAKLSDYGPAPGFVPGGPNKDFSVGSIRPPAGQPIQKSYLDFNDGFPNNSWEISEPAIYYQAAYIQLLAQAVNSNIVTNSFQIKAVNRCIEIYPNPSDNYFTVKGLLSNYNIEIYDSTGALFQSILPLGSDAVIDISNLPVGTFFIRIENLSNHLLCVQKMIKQE